MVRIFFVVFLLVCNVCAQAMIHFDPQFDQMIRSADLVGVFRVTAGATFRARLEPLKILKGKQHDAIWLTGYTDWYAGTSDTLHVGEVYFIFATKVVPFDADTVHGDGMARAGRAALAFVAHRADGYRINSATSGKYVIRDDSVYADVTQRMDAAPAVPLELFKIFVRQALARRESATVSKRFQQQIRTARQRYDSATVSNTITMLRYAHGVSYCSLFDTLARDGSPRVRLSLALLLGEVNDPRAYTVLAMLLRDADGAVQYAAITAIARWRKSVSGPLLTTFLDPEINPVVVNDEVAVLAAAQALASMRYRPALPVLRALLEAKPDGLVAASALTEAIRVLQRSGFRRYV